MKKHVLASIIWLTLFCSLLLVLFATCNMQQNQTDDYYNISKRDSLANANVQLFLSTLTKGDTLFTSVFEHRKSDYLQEQFKALYQENKGQLIWQNATTASSLPALTSYVNILQQVRNYGLSPSFYQADTILQLHNQLYPQPGLPPKATPWATMASLDAYASASVIAMASDLHTGHIKPSRMWDIPKKEIAGLSINLLQAVQNNRLTVWLEALMPQHKAYKKLHDKLNTYQSIANNGGWQTIKSGIKQGDKGPEAQALIKHLKDTGDLAANAASNTWNEAVSEALKQYQARHRLTKTANLDTKTLAKLNTPIEKIIQKIQLNLDRYRFLPPADSMGQRYVWVNIPEYLIRVFKNGEETATITGVVGEPKTATPILVDKPMKNIIFSPTWTIPQSIAREEMEYILRNPAVLIVADVDVFVDGKKVDPRKVNWKEISISRVKMRQRPKRTNSMGRAKFMFSNNYSIYLHDTPNKVDFNNSYRAQSHGCIRVQDPKRLAVELLEGGRWSEGGIKTAMFSGKEQYASLPEPVKVHLVYFTCWVDDNGLLQFARDIYGHDRRQLPQLL